MATIKYLSPYELRIMAADIASGKTISNVLHLRTGVSSVPPAFGTPIAGGGDTATLLAAIKASFETNMLPVLSVKYNLSEYVLRRIVGWKYGKPFFPVLTVSPGVTTIITSATVLPFATGDMVSITDVGGVTGANGIFVASVIGPKSFTIGVNTVGQVWTGGGQFQEAAGTPGFTYDDQEVLTSSASGAITGDSYALFADASVRRLSGSTGKSFQGRNSFAPVGESQVVNGAFTSAAKTAFATALAAWNNFFLNGGTETTGSGQSLFSNVSLKLALTQSSPFTSSGHFQVLVTNMILRPDMGSMIRRKPKLGLVIAT